MPADHQNRGTGSRRIGLIVVAGVAVFAMGFGVALLATSAGTTHDHALAAESVPSEPAPHTHGATPTDDGSAVEHDHGPRDADAVWAAATADERAAATELAEATRAVAARYADVNAALADGFRPNPQSSGVGMVHYPNYRNRHDDAVLDPEALEGLVYHVGPDGRTVLVGALFTAGRGPLPPTPGGDITNWHSHVPGCMHPADTPSCEGQVPLYMMHVWLLDGVTDPFADSFLGAVGGTRADARAALRAAASV